MIPLKTLQSRMAFSDSFQWCNLSLAAILWLSAGIDSASAQLSTDNSVLAVQNIQSDALSLAFASDGAHVVSGTYDGRVQLWEVTSGRLLRTMEGHYQQVYSVAFSADGTRLLSSGKDKTVKEWDAKTGRLIRSIAMQSPAKGFTTTVFSPDLRTLLSGQEMNGGDDKSMKQWDAATGRLLRAFPNEFSKVGSVAFSADGSRVASSDWTSRMNNTKGQITFTYIQYIKTWDVRDGRLLRSITQQVEDAQEFKTLVLSRDGSRVIHGTWEYGSTPYYAKLSEVSTGRTQYSFSGLVGGIIAAAFSPDARHIVTMDAKGGTLRLWEADTGRLLNVLSQSGGHGVLTFSPDSTTVAFSNGDGIKLWDITTGKLSQSFGRKQEYSYGNSSVYESGGKRIVIGGSRVRTWGTETPQSLASVPAPGPDAIARVIARDGEKVFWTLNDNQTMVMTDTATGRILATFLNPSQYFSAMAVSADATRMASSFALEYSIRVWDTSTGKLLKTIVTGRKANVYSIAFSPDGTLILTGAAYEDMKLWNASTGNLVRSFPTAKTQTTAVAFSPNGAQIFSGDYDHAIKQWDVAGGRLVRTYLGHRESIHGLAISADGKQMLSTSDDNQVKLWDIAGGQQLQTISRQTRSVSFSFDGKRAILDNEIFDLATGARLVSLIGAQNDDWLAITPEGYFVGSKKGAELLSIVRGFDVWSIDQAYDALYRPDLVREKLAGDPAGKVKTASAKLDLEKVIASGSPPKVAIRSPASGFSSPTDEVVVDPTVAEQGGGIGKIEWRVNGVTLGVETRGLERVEAAVSSGKILTMHRSLALERGQNRIEVLAYNAKDLVASEPASVMVTWDGETTAFPPKLYVLAVGVNDYYDSRLRLTYAVPDATALAEGLRKAGTGLYAGVDVTTVLDADVTVANLDKVFTDIGRKAQPRDVFVFFLAGHGKTRNGRYYFLPRDFRYENEDSIEKTGMGQDKFQAWFSRISARKSILLYDTCESGSLTGTNTRGSDIDERLGALNRMTRATGRTFLTATTDDAPALEGYRGHGIFTYALLDALQHADINGNGLIEVSELADYIDRKVPDISFEVFKLRQIPQRNIVGNNFSIANKLMTAQTITIDSSTTSSTISAKPTHITNTQSSVFPTTIASSTPAQSLTKGTLVTLIKTADGWGLVAKDGKLLGYVLQSQLDPVH